LKIFQKVLLTSSLFALTSASFAETNKTFIKNKNKETNSVIEKPVLIAEKPGNYEGFDTLKITVTGTRTERSIKDVPASVTSYDYDEINSLAPLDWRDLFKYDASISSQDFVRGDGGPAARSYAKGDKGNINIRGVEGNRILTLIDGIPIPRFSYGRSGTFAASRLNYIDFSTVGNAEVLKGAGSSLYGSDAMGGVVSLKSLSPEDILKDGQSSATEISSYFNSQNSSYQPSLKYAFREGTLSGVLSMTTGSFEELNRNTESKYQSDIDGDLNGYYIKLINSTGKTDYSFVYETFDKDTTSRATDYINAKEFTQSARDITDNTRTRVSLGFDYKADEDKFIDNLSGKIYMNTMEHKNNYEQVYSAFAKNETKVDLDQEMFGGNLQATNNFEYKGINQKLTYGIEYNNNEASRTRDTFTNGAKTGAYKSNPDTDILRLGVYVQDEISLDNWDVIAGIRYDANNIDAKADDLWYASGSQYLNDLEGTVGKPISKDFSNISPSISVINKVNDTYNLYGKYSRSFRAPSWEDLNSSRISIGTRANYATIGNPNLKAESGDNFELGIKGRTEKADFGISTFLNKYKDFLEKSTNDGTLNVMLNTRDGSKVGSVNPDGSKDIDILRTKNVDSVDIWGVELDYKYHFSERNKGLSLTTSASLINGENKTDNEKLDSVNPFTAIANFEYKFPNNKLIASLTNTYVASPSPSATYTKGVLNRRTGQYDNTNSYIPDAFITTDLVVKYNPTKNFMTDIGIYNIFDTTYYLWSDIRSNGLIGTDDIAYQRYAQPGISIKAGFKWRF